MLLGIVSRVCLASLAMIRAVAGEDTAAMQDIAGTWVSKSNTVFTGPGFYDPVDELLIEPELPGVSYSFTEDGHFEQALYRVKGNAQNHSCPTAVLIWQHGTYEVLANGSIILNPIAVDGRQLLSDPCGTSFDHSVYSRYTQMTWFLKYIKYLDDYHGRWKLQLYNFDGSPVQPLYLAYRPPLMLPTSALNPTNKASETATSLGVKAKRSLEKMYNTNAVLSKGGDYDKYWWFAVSGLSMASASYFFLL